MKTIAHDMLLRWLVADGMDAGLAVNLAPVLLNQRSNMERYAALAHYLPADKAGDVLNRCPIFQESR